MIIFDIKLGRFSLLVEQWPLRVPYQVTKERRGEILIDVQRYRIMLTNHREESLQHSQ